MKKRIYWNKSGLVVWLLLLLCSCGEETPVQEGRVPQAVQVRCEATIDATGYDSDSELVPMGATRASGSYVVTQLNTSALLVLKELPDDKWAVMERRENVISAQDFSNQLNNDEQLRISNVDCVLLPGKYKFLLVVNHIDLNHKIEPEAILSGSELISNRLFATYADFFFDSRDVTLEKTNGLTEESGGKIKTVSFSLKRYSALIRFIIEGEGFAKLTPSTIAWDVSGINQQPFCIGIDVMGKDAMDDKQQGWDTEVSGMKNKYKVDGKEWLFSKSATENTSPAVYATQEKMYLQLTIRKISSKLEGPFFEGPHTLESVPVQRNHITTIVIRKIGDNKIETVLNPTVSDWNAAYPPLNYVELNNN